MAIVPVAVWLFPFGGLKGMNSAIHELFWLGCVAAIAPIIRVSARDRANQVNLSICLLVSVSLAGVLIAYFTPGMPD